MAITGAVGAALRQEAPYQAEIAMGAQLIVDFQGARSGRRPYYWYRGTRYTSPEKIPGWSFSRNSVGYAEDSAGNLIQFPANVPRVTDLGLLGEESRANLLLQSQALDNGAWSTKSNTSVAADAVTAPDGTLTADFVKEGAATNIYSYVAQSPTVASSTTYTVSVFAKAGTRRYFWIEPNFTGYTNSGTFDLQAGTFSGAGASMRYLSNGWYRCSVTFTTGASTTSISLRFGMSTTNAVAPYTGDNVSGLYMWGAQLEQASNPSSYIPTTTASATRAADIASVRGLVLILGKFRTNLITLSEALNAAPWSGDKITVTPDQATAPDGGNTADMITATGAAGRHIAYQSFGSLRSSGSYTFSTHLKQGAGRYAQVQLSQAGRSYGVVFDLQAGIATATYTANTSPGAASSIVSAGNGWWRVSVTLDMLAGVASYPVIALSDAATPTYESNGSPVFTPSGQTIYAWGSQLEYGAAATTYIPTPNAEASAGSAVTILVAEGGFAGASGYPQAWALDNGANRIEQFINATNGALYINYDALGLNRLLSGVGGNGPRRIAVRLRPNELGSAVDGGGVSTQTGLSALQDMDRLTIGARPGGSQFLNGYIQRLVILGDVDDNQLQRLAA